MTTAAEVPPTVPPMRLSGLEPVLIGAGSLFVNVGERTNVTGSKAFARMILERRVRGGPGGGAPAGGKRRAGHRHQHGRGHARQQGRDGALPQPDRRRARDRARADHDRQLEVERDRSRPEVHPGQGHRQLDLDEGRRGRVPAPGQAGAALRRGRGGDGLRRKGPGRHLRSARSRSASAPTACWSTRSASRPRTSSSTPTSSPSPPASRSTTTTRSTSSRPRAGSSRTCRAPRSRAACRNVSFSFRGNDPVREAIHTVFLYHAIQAGMDMGIVNAGMVGVYDDLEPELRERVEDVVLNRRDGRRRAPDRDRRERQGRRPRTTAPRLAWRAKPVRRAPVPRAGARHHRLHRRRHRRSLAGDPGRGRAAAARDRRPADGRHEHRRRPVRPGQDVPAAGGEERARDEAGGGPPAALHRGREEALLVDAGGEAKAKGKIVIATVKGDVHDIGKNIVTVVLQCNNFEVVNMGVMVPCQDILAKAKVEGADIIGLSRPDHAEPGRDAARRRRDAARRLLPHQEDPAADRRRHHQPRAHRGEDRAALRRPGGLRARRVAQRGRVQRSAVATTAPRATSPS